MRKILLFGALTFSCCLLQAQMGGDSPSRFQENVIRIKFFDDAAFQAIKGTLVDDENNTLGDFDTQTSWGHWQRICNQPDSLINRWRANATKYHGRHIPDAKSDYYFAFTLKLNYDSLITEWKKFAFIEKISRVPKFELPTPDYSISHELYLDPTIGINARQVWSNYGITGQGIKCVDIEFLFNSSHEDLPPVTIVTGTTPIEPSWDAATISAFKNHGTNTLGVLAAKNNGWGTTGIAYGSQFGFESPTNLVLGNDVAGAIYQAVAYLDPGDVIVIEQQVIGPNYNGSIDPNIGKLPVEWNESSHTAVTYAVGQGIIVVEAAGNGSQNLDVSPNAPGDNGHYPFVNSNNSGAIMVGAGTPPAVSMSQIGASLPSVTLGPTRSRLYFSNYGARLDLQGWGLAVATTSWDLSHSPLYWSEGNNRAFTNEYNGTSSSSPVVAGAAILLQSAYKNATGQVLSPAQTKNYLVTTGQPQQGNTTYPTSQKIGPLPNALAAVQQMYSQTAFTVSQNSSICLGSSKVLIATGGSGNFTWINTNNSSVICSNCSTVTVSPTVTTTYSVDDNINTSSPVKYVTVTVLSLPNANAGSDVTIQAGASTTLQGSGGGSYTWSPSSSLSNPNVWNPVASPSSTTTYILTVTDGNGCADTDPVVVTVQGGGGGAPPNDNPCSATSLTVSAGCNYATGTNLNATSTTNPSTPSMCGTSSTSGSSSGGYSGGDVWFKAVVPSSGQLIINTQIQSSVYDLVLGVYTGGSCSSLNQIACNDDRVLGSNYMPYLSLTSLTPGQTIYIRVWEFGNNVSGTFGICVQNPGGSSSNDPDLIVSINTISTTTPDPGDQVTLNMTVTNSGAVAVNSSFTARIALSTDATLNYSNDAQLSGSTQTISSLGAGASTSFSKTVTIPSSTADGNYYLIAEVDKLNDQIDESNENNNTSNRSIVVGTISANEVDLDVYNEIVTPSTGLAPGMQINVACVVENDGNTTASGARLGYFFSNDANYNPGIDVYLGDDGLGSTTLVPGGSSSENANVYVPNVTSTGTKYILFVADYQNVTTDVNLSNNVESYPITVTTLNPARPDYIGQVIELELDGLPVNPNNLTPYKELNVRVQLLNIGNLDGTIDYRTRCVISDDVIMSDDDFLIGVSTNSNGLDLGDTLIVSPDEPLSGLDLGPKYLITYVDDLLTTVESNEANNTVIIPVTLIADTFSLPDLTVALTSITPYSSDLGDTLMVSGYITNIGVGPANPPFNTDFFLSIDDQFQGDGVEQGDLQGIFINHVINVGDTFFFTAPVFSEEVTQPGPYYFLAVVDEGQDVFELTKANNVSSTPVYIQSVACYYNLDFNADTIDYNQTFGNWNVVHTEENCSWWSSENSSWISGTTDPVSSPTTGNGSTTYFPSINHSPYPRTATITIMNNTVTVYQNGCPIMPAELGQDIVFCNSATLNAALDTSQTIFTWSTGATSPNISVNSTGLYSVTITNSYGCITSDTIQVTISNSSTAPTSVTTSQNPTCYGNSVLLSQSGGVLGQAYEWKWYSGSCGGSLMGTGSQVLVSPNGTSQYFVRAEGCDTTACTPITITTLSLPAIDAGIDVTINEGDTTLLTASGGISYLWSTGDITATTSVSPIATSYFYVRGSDNNGCETIDSVLVTVVHNCSNLVASITPSGATSFCFGGNVTLAANAGMASYLWSNGDTAQSITVSQSGNFYVAITDNFSCPATSQSISITVNALPYADAGIDQSVCNGSSVSIGSPQTPGYTYTWSPSTTLNNSQMAMPFATPTAQTTYELTVTNSFGCTATDQTSISINALPNVTANTTANTVCNGASITLTGGGASTYTWSNGVTDGVAFIPSATVTYTVTGTDANGCQNTATNLVSILAAPTASISYNNNGYTYNFSSNIQGNATTFSWDFGDSDTSILENPVHTYSQVGSFTVTLTVSNICGSNTYQQTININPNCTYTVSQNTVVADSNGTSQAITVTCGVSCLWNVNIGNCSWLAVFPLNGAGLDSFTITIPATTDTFVRQCTLTVEGQAISVTQYGKQGSISCAPIDTSVQVNGGCDLAAATISGATYQWYKNGGQISNAISQYYTATQNGYYHVRIAVGNCAYQSGDRYLTCDTATGIDGSAVSNLKVYPNPTDGTFVINGEAKNAVKIAVNLYDMLGQIVYAKNIPLKGTIINEEIRVENLSTGIYHLQLLIDKQFYNQKLLVK